MIEDTYTCSTCGGTFAKEITDEESIRESEKIFGPIPEEDRRIVCDDCFKDILRAQRNKSVFEKFIDEWLNGA